MCVKNWEGKKKIVNQTLFFLTFKDGWPNIMLIKNSLEGCECSCLIHSRNNFFVQVKCFNTTSRVYRAVKSNSVGHSESTSISLKTIRLNFPFLLLTIASSQRLQGTETKSINFSCSFSFAFLHIYTFPKFLQVQIQ